MEVVDRVIATATTNGLIKLWLIARVACKTKREFCAFTRMGESKVHSWIEAFRLFV
jgi:hypothetical protein